MTVYQCRGHWQCYEWGVPQVRQCGVALVGQGSCLIRKRAPSWLFHQHRQTSGKLLWYRVGGERKGMKQSWRGYSNITLKMKVWAIIFPIVQAHAYFSTKTYLVPVKQLSSVAPFHLYFEWCQLNKSVRWLRCSNSIKVTGLLLLH